VTAIAKCGSTLELHVPEEGFPTLSFLESNLKLYDRLSSDVDNVELGLTADSPSTEKRKVKDMFLSDVPASTSQCNRAWVELCAFVHGDPNGDQLIGYRPSERVKLDVWKRILEGSLLHDINLERQFQVKSLWGAVLDEGEVEPFPWELFEAVVRRLTESPGLGEPQLFDAKLECEHWTQANQDTYH
jgi:sister chromatid cohesion protein DCC1